MSQDQNFSQIVNKLFFGIDLSDKSITLYDKLLSTSQLQHYDNSIRQWNLNVTLEMNSSKAWSSNHKFTFTESPLPDLKIEKGVIELKLGETDSTKKLLDLNWRVEFNDKTTAAKYFNKLNQLFGEVSTNKKFEHDKEIGEIAEFSTRKQVDTGVKNITLFLSKSPTTKKYEVLLLFGNELTDK